MRTLHISIYTILLIFAVQITAVAQSGNLSETFKKSFNETVQKVQQTDDADEKRALLNQSFVNMMDAIDRIDSMATLSEEESAQLDYFKNDIASLQNELNGQNGFDEIMDQDLTDFSEYSQQYFEQASRVITISVSTALLIIIILLLLA